MGMASHGEWHRVGNGIAWGIRSCSHGCDRTIYLNKALIEYRNTLHPSSKPLSRMREITGVVSASSKYIDDPLADLQK
jgi:hypothetical protein